ncbi:MAG: DUF2480 family protein [Chitinophagales bacterium]|nr:DUF2480 family protein [Chitinophagales bacterium]MDW8274099.1 DUF2480 family protein [Chitinophagales bacterium]
MNETKPITNKAQNRSVSEINLDDFFPKSDEIASIDMAEFLFQGLLLKESDFRKKIEEIDWERFKDKYVCLYCSTQAIVPMWAYMIIASRLGKYAKDVACTDVSNSGKIFLLRNILKIKTEDYKDKRVVVRGCGNNDIDESAYALLAFHLSKHVRSLLFGEACSSVPVFKKEID